MNNKRKARPAGATRYSIDCNRSPRTRTVSAQGVYNNSFFMHAATALVGNVVQIHLRSGNIYEGIFRTFSQNFDVALELPCCIKSNRNVVDESKMVTNCMIFTFDNIVSISAKEFDPHYAVGGTFQTDSAISEKCNGNRMEEKELEPWDSTGMNGDIDLELDGTSNGWDANDMFSKNEKSFGVQSTFDDSLSDYTVQLDKKETAEFKEAEAKAEKLANEIENNPSCKERLDLENGDEEALFAAVERPPAPHVADHSSKATQKPILNNQPSTPNAAPPHAVNSTSQSGPSIKAPVASVEKYVPPMTKRKAIQTTKSIRTTPPPPNAINGPPMHVTHNSKATGYQNIQSGPTYVHQSYGIIPPGSQPYRHASGMSSQKGIGEGNNNNKMLPQRNIRQYSGQSSSSYVDQNQGVMNKNVQLQGNNVCVQHLPNNNIAENSHQMQSMGMQHVIMPSGGNNQSGPPTQRISSKSSREEQVQDLRKFQQDFHLVGSNQPPINQQLPQQHLQINQGKGNNIPPIHSQSSVSPTQTHQQTQIHHGVSSHQQKPQAPIQQQTQHSHPHSDNSPPGPIQVSPPTQQHIAAAETKIYQGHPNQSINQQAPTTINTPNPSSDYGMQQSQLQTKAAVGNNIINKPVSEPPNEKATPPSGLVKKHVLNPAAKPFTPRSPSTPNASRPHTPQTPIQQITPGIFAAQGQFYVVPQQQAFPTAAHNVGQPQRLRRGTMTVSPAAAAATGQPLLTAAPFVHYPQGPHPSHFPGQPYQQMVRLYHEPQPQPIPFLTQTPPSTTPSPGQPHQQYHPPPQPSPAGGGPQNSYGPANPPAGPFQVICPVLPHPQLVHNYYSSSQNPPQNQQFQIVMQHPGQ